MNFSMRGLKQRRGGRVVIVVLILTLLLASCALDDNNSGQLNGIWLDSYGTTIRINTSAKTIEYEGSYEGSIANAADFDADSGVLIIQFTKYWDLDYSDYPNVTSSENTANIGKYGALYWKDLTANSVYMADAYDSSYNHAMYDTIEAAQTAFTPAADKVGDYVDWSITSPYTKQ